MVVRRLKALEKIWEEGAGLKGLPGKVVLLRGRMPVLLRGGGSKSSSPSPSESSLNAILATLSSIGLD